MIPLSFPMHGGFAVAPEPFSEDDFLEKARNALETLEQRQQAALSGKPPNGARGSVATLINAPNMRRRSTIAPPTHRRRPTVSKHGLITAEDFPTLDWGADVLATDLSRTEFVCGVAATPVMDRKLVKIGILAARAIICMQHPDIVVPEVLLADFSTAGSGSVLMCEERSRFSNLGVQPDIDPSLRQRTLDVLQMELHLDLGHFMEQVPAPCMIYSVDVWDTLNVRNALNNGNTANSNKPPAAVSVEPTESVGLHDLVAPDAVDSAVQQQPAQSIVDKVLRKGKVVPLQLLRKVLNTADDPEGPLERFFPNPKQAAKRHVALVTNTVHLLPPVYPLGVRDFSTFLARRFRPEFLREYGGLPLVSTACFASCPVGSTNTAKVDLFHATLKLFNHNIPACAASLNVEPRVLHGEDLCNRLHMFGVNLRYLGWLLPWVKSAEVERAILTEVTARSYKRVEELRDVERHERLINALKKVGKMETAPSSADPVDDGEVEFTELTRVAVNKFYPPHLWVPLPRFLPSELQLLSRMHLRYGIVLEVLEAWGEDEGGDSDGDDDPSSKPPATAAAGSEEILDPQSTMSGTKSTVGALETDSSNAFFSKDVECGSLAVDPLLSSESKRRRKSLSSAQLRQIVEGVDFSLELSSTSIPATPHVEQAYEFDTILHPEVIDSQRVETRILDMVRRQRFVFLPGRFPILSREYAIASTSSNGLQVYFRFLQDALLLRSDTLASRGSHLLSPRLTPLLKGLAQIAAQLFPFETSSASDQSATAYLKQCVSVFQTNTESRRKAKKAAAVHGAETHWNDWDRLWMQNITDPEFWLSTSTLALATFFLQSDQVDSCLSICNDGLQTARNTRVRFEFLYVSVKAFLSRISLHSEKRKIQQMEMLRKRDLMKVADGATAKYYEPSFRVGEIGAPGLVQWLGNQNEPAAESMTSHPNVTATEMPQIVDDDEDDFALSMMDMKEAIDCKNDTTAASASVLPLVVDILRILPLAVPPAHPIRDQLYVKLLRIIEPLIEPDVFKGAVHVLSPGSDGTSSTGLRAEGAAAHMSNASQAEGAAQEELLLQHHEQNFASIGVPLETLQVLKEQRDAFLARVTPCYHFVSPSVMRFNVEDGKFPDLEDMSAVISHHAASGGTTFSATTFTDVMTALDAFLAPDREGFQEFDSKVVMVLVCETGMTCIAAESTRNMVEMRTLNAASMKRLSQWIAAAGGARTATTASDDMDDDDDALVDTSEGGLGLPSFAPIGATPVVNAGVRQVSDHAKLWATDKKNGVMVAAPLLPLTTMMPIVLDCVADGPVDRDFLHRSLPGLSTLQLRLLSQNPKVVIFLDGYDAVAQADAMASVATLAHASPSEAYRDVMTWKAKKVFLVPRKQVGRVTPHELRCLMYPRDAHFETAYTGQSVFYAVLRWSELHLAKALQRQVASFWDALPHVVGRYPKELRQRHTYPLILSRWQLLRSCLPGLLRRMLNPLLASLVGYALPLILPFALAFGQRRISAIEVLDCVVFSQFVAMEPNLQMQAEAMLYGLVLATLMTQTSASTAKFEPRAATFKHCLPIRISSDGASVSFIHPIFISYFLSVRCTLEMLEGEDSIPACFSAPFARELFSMTLSRILIQSPMRTSKSKLAAKALMDMMKDRKQGVLMKAMAKFSDARKRRQLRGGEWLARRELTMESDAVLIDLLADRVISVAAFRRALLLHATTTSGSGPTLSREARHIIANAFSILVRAKFPFSGRSLRGLEFHSACVDGLVAVACDGRSSVWHSTTARGANFSFADLTSADFRSLDLGSEPKIDVMHKTCTMTAVCVSELEADILFTGDDGGHVSRWRVDTGLAEVSVKISAPVARMALGVSSTMLAIAKNSTDTTIEIRDATSLNRIALLSGGHKARVTGVQWLTETLLVTSGFDWQVLLWEIPSTLVPPKIVIPSEADADNEGSDGAPASPSAEEAPELAPKFPSPKRERPVDTNAGIVDGSLPSIRSIGQLAVSADGAKKASRRLLPADVLASTKVWSAQPANKGATALRLPNGGFVLQPIRVVRSHHVHVTALALCRVHRWVAVIGGDGKGFVFPVDEKTQREGQRSPLMARDTTRPFISLTFSSDEVLGASCCVFVPDGSKLIVPTNRGLKLIDTVSGSTSLNLVFPGQATGIPKSIAVSDDGTLIAADCDRRVFVWDVVSGHVVLQSEPFFPEARTASAAAISPSMVAEVYFTKRGKSLISTYWGGGIRIVPLLQEAQGSAGDTNAGKRQVSLDASGKGTLRFTNEYRWLMLVNHGAQMVGISFQGHVDVIDSESGMTLGSCGRVTDDASHAAADLATDFVSVVCGSALHIFTTFKRLPSKIIATSTKHVTALAMVPSSRTSRWSCLKTAFAVTCGLDRIVKIWDCDAGVMAGLVPLEFAVASLTSGHQSLCALTGFVASRSLTLATMQIDIFGPMPKKRIGNQIGRLFLTPEGDVTLPLQRLLCFCVKRKYRDHANVIAEPVGLFSRYVMPFLRTQVSLNAQQKASCVVKIPSKDTIIRLAVGGPQDSIAAVTYDRVLSIWDLQKEKVMRVPQEVHAMAITQVDVSPDMSRWTALEEKHAAVQTVPLSSDVLVATASADGTAIVTVAASGHRLVAIRPSSQSVMWSAKFVRRGPDGRDAADAHADVPFALGNHQLITVGSDAIVRKWALTGAPCAVGSKHPVVSLSATELPGWLESCNLHILKDILKGKIGGDLMDLPLEAVIPVFTPLLPPRRSPTRSPSFGRRRSSVSRFAMLPPLQRSSSTTKSDHHGSVASRHSIAETVSPPAAASPIRRRQSSVCVDDDDVAGPAPTMVDLEQLRVALKRVRERSYETVSITAMDDAELTGEMFDAYTPQQVATFFEHFATSASSGVPRCLVAAGALVRDRKLTGAQIRQVKTSTELRSLLLAGATYDEMAKVVFNEASIVRNSRLKEGFSDKSVDDVLMFARSKPPWQEVCLSLLGYNGKELLDRTNFVNQLVIICHDCGRRVEARTMCPVRRTNHMHISPQLDPDSQKGMSALVSVLKDAMNALAEGMVDIVRMLPANVKFSCGVFWHPMLNDSGLVSLVQFNLGDILSSKTVVVNSAVLTVTVTEKNAPRLVVVTEEHPRQLQKLAGVRGYTGPAPLAVRMGFPTPPGWKRLGELTFAGAGDTVGSHDSLAASQSQSSSPMGTRHGFLGAHNSSSGVKYLFHDRAPQSPHPTMPRVSTAYHADEVECSHAVVEVLTMALAATIPAPKPPKPHHRFRRVAAVASDASPLGVGGDNGVESTTLSVDVRDLVSAAALRGEKTVRFLIVAESIAEGRDSIAPACRPVLTVNFYDENKLCACSSRCRWFPIQPPPLRPNQPPPPAIVGEGFMTPPTPADTSSTTPRARVATLGETLRVKHEVSSSETYTATLLCDRFCNIHSACAGHKCPSGSAACRRAPYVVWETVEYRGGLFVGTCLRGASNVAAANSRHMTEHAKRPRVAEERRPHAEAFLRGLGISLSASQTVAGFDTSTSTASIASPQAKLRHSDSETPTTVVAPVGVTFADSGTTVTTFKQVLDSRGI